MRQIRKIQGDTKIAPEYLSRKYECLCHQCPEQSYYKGMTISYGASYEKQFDIDDMETSWGKLMYL